MEKTTNGRSAVLWTNYMIVFADLFQVAFVLPILPTIITNLPGADASWVALAISVDSAGVAIGAPILGTLADCFGRRPALLVSTVGSALTAAGLGFAKSYWLILVLRLVNGFTGSTTGIANAYIADITTVDERPIYMSNMNAAQGVGMIVGPLVGVFLFSLGGIALACFGAGAVSVVNFLCIFAFLPESPAIASPRAASAEASLPVAEPEDAEGIAPGRADRLPWQVWVLFFCGVLWAPMPMVLDTFGNLYITEMFHNGDSIKGTQAFGHTLIGTGLVYLGTPLLLYKPTLRLLGFEGEVAAGGIIGVAGWCGNALATSSKMFSGSCMVWALGQQFTGPGVPTLITKFSPPTCYGRALGWYSAVNSISRGASPLLLSPLFEGRATQKLVFFIPAACIGCVAATLVSLSVSSRRKPVQEVVQKAAESARIRPKSEAKSCGYGAPHSV